LATYQDRSTYMDNIRTMLVFIVVFSHVISMFSYPLNYWWPVIDTTGSSGVYETILAILDIFMMPHILFIAAFFIFYSLKTKSAQEYIIKRFVRLYVPLVVFVFCAADVFYQIRLNRLNSSDVVYLTTFLDFWRDFMNFSIITFSGEGSMLNQTNFSMAHAWFLSFLFPITFVTVLLSLPFRKKEKARKKIDKRKKIIVTTIIFAVVLSIVYTGLAILFYFTHIGFSAWLRVLGCIEVRLNQFFILLPLFLFGLYVYKKEWLTKGDIGSWKMWGILSAVFIFIRVLLFYNGLLPSLEEIFKVVEHNLTFTDKLDFPSLAESYTTISVIMTITLPPTCIFLLMFFLSFAKKYFNRSNIITAFCSKHSMNVFILHYVAILVLQYAFANIPVAPIIKIVVMMGIAIAACLWLSHRFVYPHPLISIVFFVALKLVALFAGFHFYYKALLILIFISLAGALYESRRFLTSVRTNR
jgi:hypothetical protein